MMVSIQLISPASEETKETRQVMDLAESIIVSIQLISPASEEGLVEFCYTELSLRFPFK